MIELVVLPPAAKFIKKLKDKKLKQLYREAIDEIVADPSIGEDKIMIMDLLGQNLETLMKNNIAHCLSLKSVLMCAIQMVSE